LLVYPNPADDYINVSFSLNELNYQIMDCSSKIVAKGKVQNGKKIHLENLTSGIYIITFRDAEFSENYKLIISHE
jgi:hypothetical protein